MIEEALFSLLSSDETIAALVADRIEPEMTSEGSALPAITYSRLTGTPTFTLLGSTSGLQTDRFGFDCRAATYLDSLTLFELVRKRLDGFRGHAAGEQINWIQHDAGHNDFDGPVDGSGRGAFSAWIEFDVQYGVEVPIAVAG